MRGNGVGFAPLGNDRWFCQYAEDRSLRDLSVATDSQKSRRCDYAPEGGTVTRAD